MCFYSINKKEDLEYRYKGGSRMAEVDNENKVEGVFGGVEFNSQEQKVQAENIEGIETNIFEAENANQNVFKKVDTQLPTKPSIWSRIRATLFKDFSFKIELTPYQQKIENELNDFLHQEVSFKSFFSSSKKRNSNL